MKLPGQGTAVVDYDMTRNPADADVITVWASDTDPVLAALQDMGLCGLSKTASPNQKIRWQAVFLVGPAGAGKSWLRTKKYLKYVDFKLVDPDEVKKTHPDYDPAQPYLVHDWSKEISDGQFRGTVTDGTGTPLVVDGTGRNAHGIARKAKLAEAHGYRTFLVYVWVPKEVSIFRNRNRERFVPESKVLQAFDEIFVSFRTLKTMVDRYKVIPNFTRKDLKGAKADWEMYPPPQRVKPPRPGDSNYGLERAASVNVVSVNLGPPTLAALVKKVAGSARLSKASREDATDHVAEAMEAFRQKNRMPQDRNLGTRVHRDKKKFHKTKRQKNKQNLKDRAWDD